MTGVLERLQADGGEEPRLGPVDAGPLGFRLRVRRSVRAFWVDVPADGRMVCAWARQGNWPRLVPWGLSEGCRESFMQWLMDPVGPVDLTVCHRIAVELAPEVYGVPWWTAGRVAASIAEQWDRYAAWCVAHGFDPAGASAHRVTASGLAWLRSGVQEQKDSRKLETALFAPPKPSRRQARNVPGFTPEDQAAAFQAALANMGESG